MEIMKEIAINESMSKEMVSILPNSKSDMMKMEKIMDKMKKEKIDMNKMKAMDKKPEKKEEHKSHH